MIRVLASHPGHLSEEHTHNPYCASPYAESAGHSRSLDRQRLLPQARLNVQIWTAIALTETRPESVQGLRIRERASHGVDHWELSVSAGGLGTACPCDLYR